MSWSKVNNKYNKPFGWWYNKIMCELAWHFVDHDKTYYKYLNRLCKYGFNLYGDKL
jgi:hypothetical protein